jgi:hypothetical protein
MDDMRVEHDCRHPRFQDAPVVNNSLSSTALIA